VFSGRPTNNGRRWRGAGHRVIDDVPPASN
jgi:hypothetical protein